MMIQSENNDNINQKIKIDLSKRDSEGKEKKKVGLSEMKDLLNMEEEEEWIQKRVELKLKKRMSNDRFIPCRKESKLDVMLSSAHLDNENTDPQKNTSLTMADLYKKHVLALNDTSSTQNMFKYGQQQPPLHPHKDNQLKKRQESKGHEGSKRVHCKTPFKILDAPNLQDDFYLNLVDWSSQNLLGVALNNSVYLWNGANNKVSKLLEHQQNISSINWNRSGHLMAVGLDDGGVQLWDMHKHKLLQDYNDIHTQRVSSLNFNSGNIMATGSRDKTISLLDIRQHKAFSKLKEHTQEVCGLKWSFDDQQLASGGNDNKLFIWNINQTQPIRRFTKHKAAVKALAWSPHQHGLLVSGGGTADRTIRFWNTVTDQLINTLETDSQVCNLLFAKNQNDLISTHGYSQNQVHVWNYPRMNKQATLTGHTSRVLFLAMSPDGDTICTGAGDETLRFWKLYNHSHSNQHLCQSKLTNSDFR